MSNFNPAIPTGAESLSNIQLDFNGSTFDFHRGSYDETILDASSVSASTAVLATAFGNGIIAWAEITSGLPPGSASTTFALKVQAVAPVGTNRFVTLAATTARSASGIVAVMIQPGISSTAGSALTTANMPVPRNIRILASISAAATSRGMVLALGLSHLI